MSGKPPKAQIAHDLTMLHLDKNYPNLSPVDLANQYEIIYDEIKQALRKPTVKNWL